MTAAKKRLASISVGLAMVLSGCAGGTGSGSGDETAMHKIYRVMGATVATPQNGDALTRTVN